MTTPVCITIVSVAVLAFLAFLIWKEPQAVSEFFSNKAHLGAIAATITAAIPVAAAFIPALAKFQDLLIAFVIGICGAWGVAIHTTGKVLAARIAAAPDNSKGNKS